MLRWSSPQGQGGMFAGLSAAAQPPRGSGGWCRAGNGGQSDRVPGGQVRRCIFIAATDDANAAADDVAAVGGCRRPPPPPPLLWRARFSAVAAASGLEAWLPVQIAGI